MIKIAIAGIGNCASALYQGLNYYKNVDHDTKEVPGLMFPNIGGYLPKDIKVVAAFDIDPRKVGRPLAEAIFAKPNCCRVFCEDLEAGPVVQMAPVYDGVSDHMLQNPENKSFRVADVEPVDITSVLLERNVDILLNYLPVGSQKGTEALAEACLKAGVSFLNCIPVFIASDPSWEKRFIEAGLPLIGDDMRSQVGASVLSQVLQELAFDRGAKVKYHQQINIGGNTDFLNMMNQDRLASKKKSKENVIRAQNDIRGIEVPEDSLFAGPSTYIPYLGDNKVAHIRLELEGFGGAPIEIDAKLSVRDSENSAGVVIDAIRYLAVARDKGVVGALRGPSAWTQKTPPEQLTYDEAKRECEKYARG